MTGENTVRLLLERSENGIQELQKHYGPLMRYIISPILSDEREREEAYNDVCLRVWEKIEDFDPDKGSFKAWLSAITRNTALNRARKISREENCEELSEHLPDAQADPEEKLLHRERLEKLRRVLARLDADEKNIFYRKYYYMQSTRQIAAELGLSERGVEGRLYRIKKKLRLQMGGEDRA